jgi:phospholipid-binding lipoprotein MlaA
MRLSLRSSARAALMGAALGLAACATAPQSAPQDDMADLDAGPNDPIENVNRAIFDFNLFLDDNVLVPVAKAYRTVLPQFAQDGVQNFMRNLRTPLIFANDVLQGEPTRASQTLGRFMTNTIVGVGGLIDVAGRQGVPFHSEDFGQTLAVWGVPEGPYLMLPIFGPSNPRDAVGLGTEFFADPLNIYLSNIDYDYIPYVRSAIQTVDTRSRNIELLDKIRSTSLDYYATIRSLYRQRRAADIRNEEAPGPAVSTSALPEALTPARQ